MNRSDDRRPRSRSRVGKRRVAAGLAALLVVGAVAWIGASRADPGQRRGTFGIPMVQDYYWGDERLTRPFNLPFAVAVGPDARVHVAATLEHRLYRMGPGGDAGGWDPFAGDGTAGWKDGDARSAWFRGPCGIVVAADGSVYVADGDDNRVRRVGPTAKVTTLPDATLTDPCGIAVDGDGNVYVADTGAHRIRRISRSGVVTTLAGTGTSGHLDGPGNVARFASPFSLALDRSGNLYVADMGNNRIRKVTASGVVSTVAGTGESGHADGPGDVARFTGPAGVTIGPDGTVYVADTGNHRIRRIGLDGVVGTVAGSGVAGFRNVMNEPLTNAMFNQPYGIAYHSEGQLIVADTFNNRIRKVNFVS